MQVDAEVLFPEQQRLAMMYVHSTQRALNEDNDY
jgi:hypothetical protein